MSRCGFKLEENDGKLNVVLVDLDGTISDSNARWASGTKREEEILNDPFMKSVFLPAAKIAKPIFLTARKESDREVTTKWLAKHGIENPVLFMYPNSEVYTDYVHWEFKHDAAQEIMKEYNVIAAFDDDVRVARRLQDLGITVFLCSTNWHGV